MTEHEVFDERLLSDIALREPVTFRQLLEVYGRTYNRTLSRALHRLDERELITSVWVDACDHRHPGERARGYKIIRNGLGKPDGRTPDPMDYEVDE